MAAALDEVDEIPQSRGDGAGSQAASVARVHAGFFLGPVPGWFVKRFQLASEPG